MTRRKEYIEDIIHTEKFRSITTDAQLNAIALFPKTKTTSLKKVLETLQEGHQYEAYRAYH